MVPPDVRSYRASSIGRADISTTAVKLRPSGPGDGKANEAPQICPHVQQFIATRTSDRQLP